MEVIPYNAISVGAGAIYHYSDELLKVCSRESSFGDFYSMARVVGSGAHKRIWIPRNMASGFTNDLRSEGINCKFQSSFKPRNEEQTRIIKESYDLLMNGENFMIEAPTGCVDRDTEYLSPTGWKPIGDYDGGLIMQFDPLLNESRFVVPEEFVKIPSKTIWYFKTKYGLEQHLSDEHRVLYMDRNQPKYKVALFGFIRRRHNKLKAGFSGKFLTTFTPILHTAFKLSEANIRLQVAVIADGSFNKKCLGSNLVCVRVKKQRKIDRLRFLLEGANIGYTEKKCTVEGFRRFYFYAPLRDKEYGCEWWGCSLEQLKLIADEVVHWDGNTENEFYTSSKASADFIQYAFTTTGKRASISVCDRVGTKHYKYKEYVVHASDRVWVSMESSSDKAIIEEIPTVDGFKYCFSVPSGFLVLRDNNSIFVTGNSGKTIMAVELIHLVGKKTIVVVTKEDIRDQWIDAITMITGLKVGSGIGIIQGDICNTTGQSIVIAMIQSLAKEQRYPEHLFKEFGFAIWDETHRAAADYFSQSCYRVPAKLRIGLSATPDRKDGKLEVLHAHIGDVKVKSKAAPLVPRVIIHKSNWEIPYVKRKNKQGEYRLVQTPHSAGKCMHVIKMLSEFYPRNITIAKFVASAYAKGRCVLVQSELKDHLATLTNLIVNQGVPVGDIAYYVGGMKTTEREHSKTKRIIMATYAMTAEATDIPKLDTLVMSTPRSDVRQIVGRILRLCDGKKEPVVFDIVDSTSSVFDGYYGSRGRWYKSIGAVVDNN